MQGQILQLELILPAAIMEFFAEYNERRKKKGM